MSVIPEYHCDLCHSKYDEPLYSIGSTYGESIHGHKDCIPEVLVILENIIEQSNLPKKDFIFSNMISEGTSLPKMINPIEEMKDPDLCNKINNLQKKCRIF